MRNMQIVISHTPSGNGEKITVYYDGDVWQLPYCWSTILMLQHIWQKVNVWTIYPHFTRDNTPHTIYHIGF